MTQLSLDDPAGTDTTPDELVLDNDFEHVDRYDLDQHSWIEIVPALIGAPEQLFARLRRDLDWSQRRRWVYNRKVDEPRLTADYPQITAIPSRALQLLAARISDVYGICYDGAWVNLYRDERDSTGWHGDWITCKREVCTVPVLTLGHPRRFLVKPRTGGPSIRFTPRSGDLLVMRGRCQTDWRHAVPKQATPAAARISVNFQSTHQMTAE